MGIQKLRDADSYVKLIQEVLNTGSNESQQTLRLL